MNRPATKKTALDREVVEHALSGVPDWITPELVEKTIEVWQPYYKERLIPEDALEIILSVGRLLEVLSAGESHETIRRPGSRQQP